MGRVLRYVEAKVLMVKIGVLLASKTCRATMLVKTSLTPCTSVNSGM